MTIESMRKRTFEKADFLITCDEHGCKSALDALDRTFGQAVVFLKSRGWRLDKVHGIWLHICPDHPERRTSTK